MGTDADDLRPVTVAAAMNAVARAAWDRWVAGGEGTDPASDIGAALAFLETGLAQLDRQRPATEG
jgi:hypothetical protein